MLKLMGYFKNIRINQPIYYVLVLTFYCSQLYAQNKIQLNFDYKSQELLKDSLNNISRDNSTHYSLKKAEDEWKKLLFFEKNLNKKPQKTYLNQIRSYSKDSLQILAVKVLSFKKLHNKGLLKKDVLLNINYYKSLLSELTQSNIIPEEYAFLEKELLKIKINEVQNAYVKSKSLNYFLISITLLLLILGIKIIRKTKNISQPELSKQEKIIKNLIISGKSNKEIANELYISLNTVKTHITNIYHKLNISNRKELILNFKK